MTQAEAATGPKLAGDPVVAVEHALTRFVRQATRPAVSKWANAVEGVSLDRADYTALARIDETEPIRPTDLAESLGIDLSAVSRQVRDLVHAALVERSPDATDQRACHLRLTDDGRALLRRMRLARQEALRRLLDDWSASDQRTLARLIGRLADTMETRVGPESPGPGGAPAANQDPESLLRPPEGSGRR
jgi:DNA-binding MarR family transcriptional regulator